MTQNQHILLAQTWDLHPNDAPFVSLIHRRPDDGPATWAVTCVGCPSILGINEAGVAVGTTNLRVHGNQTGLCYLDLIHRALACPTAMEAQHIITHSKRAAAHSYLIADPHVGSVIETSSTRVAQRTLTPDHPLIQANHCLAPSLISTRG